MTKKKNIAAVDFTHARLSARMLADLAATFVLQGDPIPIGTAKASRLIGVCANVLEQNDVAATPENLISLAQLSVRFVHPHLWPAGSEPIANAVDMAIALWAASGASAVFHAIVKCADEAEPTIPAPAEWPGSLNDFYQLIIKERLPSDAQPKFRKFLKAAIEEKITIWREMGEVWKDERIEAETQREFLRLKMDGFDKESWQNYSLHFRNWWKAKVSESRSRAGKMGKAESEREKNSFRQP